MSGFFGSVRLSPDRPGPERARPDAVSPLEMQDGIVLWADARIDNRQELLSLLGPAHSTGVFSDPELIVLVYRKWQEAGIEKLIGDFAFALWDPVRRRVLCARDHFGIRPLYYCHRPNRLLQFASSLGSLLDAPGVSARENEQMIGDYLARVSIERAATFYSDISRLPAGHWLSTGADTTNLRRYWRPLARKELRLGSDRGYADAFRTVFVEAVRCRLASAADPIATTLSGGLDSSSITCVARHLLMGTRHRLHSFSAVFPGLSPKERNRADERKYIDEVVAGGSLHPHSIAADLLSPFTELDRVMDHQSEPFYAPNLYIHWALFQAAAEQGARVFLDGLDGDSAVSDGIDRLADLARTLRWRTLAREAAALSGRSTSKPGARKIAWRYGLSPALRHLLPFRPARATGLFPRIVNAGFARRIGLEDRIAAAHQSQKAATCREKHAQALDSPAHQMGLESCYRAAAAFGLEARFPFFDRRLLELSLSMPSEQKLRNGWTRLVLRHAMAGILPPAIQWRFTKADLSPNFYRGLAGPDLSSIADVVNHPPRDLGEYVDLSALRESFHLFVNRPAAAESAAMDLYSTVILAHWLQRRARAAQPLAAPLQSLGTLAP